MNNKNKYRFALLGGDKRQAVVACELSRRGHSVGCFGLGEYSANLSCCEMCATVDKAMAGADFVLLPLPVSRDNIHLAASTEKIRLCEILKLAQRNRSVILGGLIPHEFCRACADIGIETVDYYQRESLQSMNAVPSAEGALMIAMEHTDITVSGMKVLITGYGRIGRILASILKSLGADVTVAARRDETLCEISMSGFSSARIDGEMRQPLGEYDVIFNTVPSIIFTENVIKGIKNKPLYLEIASSPGGIDSRAARAAGIEIIYAPSLPGKYSPVSAGKYVFETISEILSERRTKI